MHQQLRSISTTHKGMELSDESKNKLEIVSLLVEYTKSAAAANKAVAVNQKSQSFFENQTNNCVRIPKLDSSHRQADQKIPMHVVYAGQDSISKVCVIADLFYFYLLTLF